jgi:hypothetical protein
MAHEIGNGVLALGCLALSIAACGRFCAYVDRDGLRLGWLVIPAIYGSFFVPLLISLSLVAWLF